MERNRELHSRNRAFSLRWWLIGLFVLVPWGTVTLADDLIEQVRAALGREIIGPRQAMDDAAQFVDHRIPSVPHADTAVEWERIADRLRTEVFEKVIFRGPTKGWREAKGQVKWLDLIEAGDGYLIRKLRFEVIPNLWIPALLYEPDTIRGKIPVVLNVNGHDPVGKAAPYKQVRCINLAKRGILAMNLEWFGMGQLKNDGFQHGLINAIDLCGYAGVALHYLAMERSLDILLDLEHADRTRVGVTGLSGGGWQTIFFSGLENRVTLSCPVAGYSSFHTRTRILPDLGDSEQTPCDLATVVDYTHLTAMLAPRTSLLVFNDKDDCCYAAPTALPPLLEAAETTFRLYHASKRLHTHVNTDPGTHNYLLDNRQAFYRVVSEAWSTPDHPISPEEIPCESELKTAAYLEVPMPADNLDFHRISQQLVWGLPHDASLPNLKEELADWQASHRLRLRSIVSRTRAKSSFLSLPASLPTRSRSRAGRSGSGTPGQFQPSGWSRRI